MRRTCYSDLAWDEDIRDKALAIEAYAKQAKNTEAERRACEIRLRAERKAGALLSQLGKQPGKKTSPHDGERFANVTASNGISKKQAERWQQLAAVPDEQFEAALAAPSKPSTSSIIGKKQEPIDPKALWLWGRQANDEAAEAGLSEHQAKTAVRVANVPADEFEKAIESDSPPTVTRLADEYDAAQASGEAASGRPKSLPDGNTSATIADIGLSSKAIHDARQIRDAEDAERGIVRRVLNEMIDITCEVRRAWLSRLPAASSAPRVPCVSLLVAPSPMRVALASPPSLPPFARSPA